MKNKNTNRAKNTANHLLNYIMEEQTLRNNRDHAYAYAAGAFIAVIEAARMYGDDIQDVINRQCESTAEEIARLKALKAA